jgi:hypothetical protein
MSFKVELGEQEDDPELLRDLSFISVCYIIYKT